MYLRGFEYEENNVNCITCIGIGWCGKKSDRILEALDESKWEIDLFLLRHEGELMDAIPDKVHLLPQKAAYTVLAHPMKATLKEGHVLLTMARLYGKTAAVIYDHKHNYRDSDVNLEYSHKYTSPFMPRIQPQKEYDLAVSFLTPHYIVTKKVNAKKKIAWIHTGLFPGAD